MAPSNLPTHPLLFTQSIHSTFVIPPDTLLSNRCSTQITPSILRSSTACYHSRHTQERLDFLSISPSSSIPPCNPPWGLLNHVCHEKIMTVVLSGWSPVPVPTRSSPKNNHLIHHVPRQGFRTIVQHSRTLS